MFKQRSYTYISTRRVSFFVPSTRINEYNKRQLQGNASLENFENNYNLLDTYSDNFPPTSLKKPKSRELPISSYQYKPNSTVLDISLQSINYNFLTGTPLPTGTSSDNFYDKLRYLLYDSDIRNLYNLLKCNTGKIRKCETNLSKYEISLIIKRLIYYNDSLTHRLKFVTKNKNLIENEIDDTRTYIPTLYRLSRSVYTSTRSIFNALLNLKLSVFDYENIILFYYAKDQVNKTIELIAEVESKALKNPDDFHLTSSLWIIKMEILSNTNLKFWKIYGESIYKINHRLKLNKSFNYPHHSHNFQTLLDRYETDKKTYNLHDDINAVSVIIRGLGQHGDLTALDKLIESTYGIKNDRTGDKDVHLLEHFNIHKKVGGLMWPTSDVLISILLAYFKNGDLVTAIKINNLLIEHYSISLGLINYWTLVLKCAALFGDAVHKQLLNELKHPDTLNDKLGNSLLEITYRFFDKVWDLSQYYVKDHLTREMIKLKIKYSSSHELLTSLPTVHSKMLDSRYNKVKLDYNFNTKLVDKYIRECCLELAHRGKFLDANQIIDKFVISKQQNDELKTTLSIMQESYARETVKKNERKRKLIDDDDDNDFDLW